MFLSSQVSCCLIVVKRLSHFIFTDAPEIGLLGSQFCGLRFFSPFSHGKLFPPWFQSLIMILVSKFQLPFTLTFA